MLGCPDPHRVELLVAKEVLLFAWEVGFTRFILEGDTRNVYNKIESAEEDLSYNGSIFSDIILCATCFYIFRSNSIPRECNTVVDFLGKKALKGESGIFLEDLSEDLFSLLLDDLTN